MRNASPSMTHRYQVLESPNLGTDGLYIVSAVNIDKKFRHLDASTLVAAGNLETRTAIVASVHGHFRFSYLPIYLAGTLAQSEAEIVDALGGKLSAMVPEGFHLNISAMKRNREFMHALTGYDKVSAQVHVDTFVGRNIIDKTPFQQSCAILTGLDDVVHITDEHIFVNDNALALTGDSEFIRASTSFRGARLFDHAGKIDIHRTSLREYVTRGTYGRAHSNGPWFRSVDDQVEANK